MRRQLPCATKLRQLFEYFPDTGKLVWRRRHPWLFNDGKKTQEHQCKIWNVQHAGKEAMACDDGRGYKYGTINHKPYKAHRIIWAVFYGEAPPDYIDHINGNTYDNSIRNLRASNSRENSRNRAVQKSGDPKVNGVVKPKKSKSWVAYIGSKPRTYLGSYKHKKDAIAARKAAEIKLGYTIR